MGKRRNKRHVKPTRMLLWALSDDQSCFWCDNYVTPVEASTEHLLPVCYGGPDRVAYCRLACMDCNNRRGNDVSPWRMAKIMDELGWNPRPLSEVCPGLEGRLLA